MRRTVGHLELVWWGWWTRRVWVAYWHPCSWISWRVHLGPVEVRWLAREDEHG